MKSSLFHFPLSHHPVPVSKGWPSLPSAAVCVGRRVMRAVPAFVAKLSQSVASRRAGPATVPALSAAAALERRVWPGQGCPPAPDGWPLPRHGTRHHTHTLKRHRDTGKSQGRGETFKTPLPEERNLYRHSSKAKLNSEFHSTKKAKTVLMMSLLLNSDIALGTSPMDIVLLPCGIRVHMC